MNRGPYTIALCGHLIEVGGICDHVDHMGMDQILRRRAQYRTPAPRPTIVIAPDPAPFALRGTLGRYDTIDLSGLDGVGLTNLATAVSTERGRRAASRRFVFIDDPVRRGGSGGVEDWLDQFRKRPGVDDAGDPE